MKNSKLFNAKLLNFGVVFVERNNDKEYTMNISWEATKKHALYR